MSGRRWRHVKGNGKGEQALGPGLGPRGLHAGAVEWKRQAGRHESKPWICYCRAVCPWASYITSLSICKMGIMVLLGLL